MTAPDEPIFKRLGARPQPVLEGGRTEPGGRRVLALAGVMVGWVFFMMVLAAFGSGVGGETVGPVVIGSDVVVKPASGWTLAAGEWEVGPEGVSLKKAGAVVVFVADRYTGTTEALLGEQSSQLESEFGSFQVLPPAERIVAGHVPALSRLFSGVADGGRLEGEVVAATRGDTGVVIVALAPLGQLRRLQSDIDEMLDHLVIP